MMVCIIISSAQGKTKVLFPIYYEAERPPMSGISDGCIEREQVSIYIYNHCMMSYDIIDIIN